jgi:hypothetical protein
VLDRLRPDLAHKVWTAFMRAEGLLDDASEDTEDTDRE